MTHDDFKDWPQRASPRPLPAVAESSREKFSASERIAGSLDRKMILIFEVHPNVATPPRQVRLLDLRAGGAGHQPDERCADGDAAASQGAAACDLSEE
eukprot:642270-Pyramimonas_sp.AAC.1